MQGWHVLMAPPWTCRACTFENAEQSWLACSMCSEPREPSASAAADASASDLKSLGGLVPMDEDAPEVGPGEPPCAPGHHNSSEAASSAPSAPPAPSAPSVSPAASAAPALSEAAAQPPQVGDLHLVSWNVAGLATTQREIERWKLAGRDAAVTAATAAAASSAGERTTLKRSASSKGVRGFEEWMQRLGVDILCLQEVSRPPSPPSLPPQSLGTMAALSPLSHLHAHVNTHPPTAATLAGKDEEVGG